MLRMIMSQDSNAVNRSEYLEIEVDTTKSTSLGFTTNASTTVRYGFTEGNLTESITAVVDTKTIPTGTTKIFIKVDDSPYLTYLKLSSPMITKVKNWSGYNLPNLRLTSSNLVEVPSTLWDNCTDTSYMFQGCTNFNQALNFDTSNVTNMSYMFSGCTKFNQLLNFKTSKVTNMQSMFASCINFNRSVNFNTSNVTTMRSMFGGCSKFNSNITFNNVSKVTSIVSMFSSCSVFNQNLSYLNFRTWVDKTTYDTGTTAWAAANKPKFTAS